MLKVKFRLRSKSYSEESEGGMKVIQFLNDLLLVVVEGLKFFESRLGLRCGVRCVVGLLLVVPRCCSSWTSLLVS